MKTISTLSIILFLASTPPGASAATRTSRNFSLTTETLDAGGQRTASAHYTHDGSLGGIGGLSAVAVPAQIAKHGYLGQLFDVTGLTLSANPASVNETASRQLLARADMDDATHADLPGSSVAWSVVNGPIASISVMGLATAGAVYEHTAAVVRGAYQGWSDTLVLTVRDADADNFGSYAGDGLPDVWQVANFGLNNPAAAPDWDADNDQQNNEFEHVAGTIPTDANSRFRLRIEEVDAMPTRKKVIFSPRHADRTYAVFYRTDLSAGSLTPLAGSISSDLGFERTVTDLNATNATRFYRVRIQLAP